jgi:hypothetical protein
MDIVSEHQTVLFRLVNRLFFTRIAQQAVDGTTRGSTAGFGEIDVVKIEADGHDDGVWEPVASLA